jgi:hypothetical protein
MFPVFPVLFPVCSQFPANGFIVFPAFLFPRSRYEHSFLAFPSCTPGTPGTVGTA